VSEFSDEFFLVAKYVNLFFHFFAVVGEAWSVIAGKGAAFQDVNNPTPVVRIGEEGSEGIIEITDVNFSTVGPVAGAIVVEWNVHEPAGTKGGAGAWDCHVRTAGGEMPFILH
jgi:glucan 1,3-beta-glucosidase